LGYGLQAQVTIDETTLPEVGDVLSYRTFEDYQGDDSYTQTGADLSWTFNDFNITGDFDETYTAIEDSLGMLFPSANIQFGLQGFQSAGVITSNSVELIGVGGGNIAGFEFNTQQFPSPFVLIKRPMNFGDSYEERVGLPFALPSSAVGLDSLDIPFVSIDSIRIVTDLYKQETVDAWGNLSVLGNDYPVLKVTQQDSFAFLIDVGLTALGSFSWISLPDLLEQFGPILGEDLDVDAFIGFLPEPQGTTSYVFYTPGSKRAILQFEETQAISPIDSTMTTTIVNGSLSAEVLSSIDDLDNSFDIDITPNPASELIYIKTPVDRPLKSIQIMDMQGRIALTSSSYEQQHGLDVSTLDQGTYLLIVGTDDGYSWQRFVVSR